MTTFRPPDFSQPVLADAPEARFEPAPADGVLPNGFFSTTNLPTYVKIGGEWRLPREPRMDAAIVLTANGELFAREGRRVTKGDRVAIGLAENGSEGIFVHVRAFAAESSDGEFKFMTSAVSREKPIDYAMMATLLLQQRDHSGYIIWVTGPALVHSRARGDMVWFIEHGFVQVLLAGNAVAVHDIEAAMFGTTLGMTGTGEASVGGHGLHMRAINAVRGAGSIAAAVNTGIVTNGIMHALVKNNIPFVLCGSIRDDGPLPEVITDTIVAQDTMRSHAKRATMAVMIATALHAIATGNMLPAFVINDQDTLVELPTICVDSAEFVVSKLKDRGTHQAFGVVTNAQDFLHILRLFVERDLEARGDNAHVPASPISVSHALPKT